MKQNRKQTACTKKIAQRSIKRAVKLVAASALFLGGAVGDALAVSLSTTGTGEALLFPYYSVRNGYDTYHTLKNTSSNGKALRINFREAFGGKLVLNFNAYLPANAQWAVAITADASGGAKLLTGNKSCTAPQVPSSGVAFRNMLYQNDAFALNSLDRLTEGYLEVIEMGQIPPGSQLESNVAFVNGVPKDCAWVSQQMANAGGAVLGDSLSLNAPTGGLIGDTQLINVSKGTEFAYAALAFNQFLAGAKHMAPGNDSINLDSAAPVSTINGKRKTWLRGADAVSAVLATKTLFGSFNAQAVIHASTAVLAFAPTRPFYAGGAPFSIAEPACEPVALSVFDPNGTKRASIPALPALCRVASVLDFGGGNLLAPLLRGTLSTTSLGTDNGSFSLDFKSTANITTPSSSVNLGGLPVVGLIFQEYNNGNVGGALSIYGGALYAATPTAPVLKESMTPIMNLLLD